MFSTDWILTLFASLIPIEKHHSFLTDFFRKGWASFYDLVLTFLEKVERRLLDEDELGNVLITLK